MSDENDYSLYLCADTQGRAVRSITTPYKGHHGHVLCAVVRPANAVEVEEAEAAT